MSTFGYNLWRQLLLICVTQALFGSVNGVTRRAEMNSALHLECRDNQFIHINRVILGRMQPSCSYTLRSDHNDYMRVVSQCSGQQSCSNILLKDSTSIPCTSVGLRDSEYMDVDYTCVADFKRLSICHNTVRTMSIFEGYISSPDYPSVPGTTEPEAKINELLGVICSCQVTAITDTADLQLLLVDIPNSEHIEISDGESSRYLCNKRRSGGCINDLQPTYQSSINITYQPARSRDSKFLLRYSAVGQSSRVKVHCMMALTSAEDLKNSMTSTISTSTTASSSDADILKGEILSLEVIVGACTAAVFLLICIIVSALICRRCQNKRTMRSAGAAFNMFNRDSNPTYDIVPENQYSTIRLHPDKGTYDHFYHEPAGPGLSPEYSVPCTDLTKGGATIPPNPGMVYSRSSEASGIYESVDSIDDQLLERHSRTSHMKKSGSMPNHPAPPIPRNASTKQSVRLLVQPTKAVAPPTKAVTPPTSQKCDAKETILSDSLESMPRIDTDLSDLLRETNRRFVQQTGNRAETEKEALYDTDYMQPVTLFNTDSTQCDFIENELYMPDQ